MSNAPPPSPSPSSYLPTPNPQTPPRASQPPPSTSLLALPPYATTSPSRLQSLYSDISRQKHSNPTSYHANIEWWRAALTRIVSSNLQTAPHDGSSSRLVLSAGRPLVERVRVEGVGKPLGLGAVVTELRHTKSLFPLQEFLTARESIYDPGWLPGRIAAYVVGKPLWWALEQLGVVGEDGILPSGGTNAGYKDTGWWGDYVVLALVEKAADAVVARQREEGTGGAGGRLFSFEGFRRDFGTVLGDGDGDGEGALLGERDAKVLVRYLERDRRVVVVDKGVIKFVDKDASPEACQISAVDRGILELKSAVENMHSQVHGIQHKIDEATQKASAALRQKRKPVALSYLRSRKQLEELLTKRLGSLDTLESTLIRVEAAAGDVEIMKSYESSTLTLRAILSHPSLQRDKIDETMDAMAEASADAREVDEAVRMGAEGAIEVGVDEGELEEELDKLVREADAEAERKREEEMRERLEGVGIGVPNTTVVIKTAEGRERERVPAS